MGEFYHLNPYTRESRVKDTFVDNISLVGKLVLDAGCSTGDTTREIAKLSPDIYVDGIDIQPDNIKKALEKTSLEDLKRIDFRVGNFYHLERKKQYDSIFMMNNLYYCLFDNKMNDAQIKQIIENVNKSMVDYGHLFVSSPNRFVIYQKISSSFKLKECSRGSHKNTKFQRLKNIIIG